MLADLIKIKHLLQILYTEGNKVWDFPEDTKNIIGDFETYDFGDKDAVDYCKNIGAELPSREDFVRLREYMGAKAGTNDGYAPQVLPNLTDAKGNSNYFWSSSSVHPDYSIFAYDFNGRSGYIDNFYRDNANDNSVRCVVPRR